jgi:OOP family OmpA-OmpF porin
MNVRTKKSRGLILLATLAVPASGIAYAQPQIQAEGDITGSVSDTSAPNASEMSEGPEVKGIISGRHGEKLQVTTADGARTVVAFDNTTQIKATGGFLGLNRNRLGADALLNGLPVTVKTLQSGGYLLARQIDLKNNDLKTASMIHNGTRQGFEEQTAATEALRGRMADIGQYNIKATTNVNFDTGKFALTEQAKADLCAAAATAEGTPNALMLVVGYTDGRGSDDYNQRLSEQRAGRVINFLQQNCHWKPYRMLTPTGMAKADPLASNDTPQGMAQNRRVAVNILVSKGLDGL